MKDRFKERRGYFVKGRGWCEPDNNKATSVHPVMFSQMQKKETPEPRVTSRFVSTKQPRISKPTPRITPKFPKLR